MMKQHPYRDLVLPISEGVARPLWSVMIPTYNCAQYLRETLKSVLAQAPGADMMQIEVVDDYSQDDPAKVVAEVGQGRVGFYRQPRNVGHTKNFQTCLERSRGKLIHLLHGDDCVRDGFYAKIQQAFEQKPEIGAAFCRWLVMDEHSNWQSITSMEMPSSGLLDNWLERLAQNQGIATPAIVVRRDVYEKLGGFDHRLTWTEDWEMWARIAAQYPMWYEIEPLAAYRVHSKSNTGRYKQTGENIQDVRRAIEIIKSYLPQETAEKVSKQAKQKWADIAIFTAAQMVMARDTKGAIAQTREALNCSQSLRTIQAVFRFWLSTGIRWGWQTLRRKY
jgi:glycosyltransferase involved in cell wall biosynthesis